MRDDTAGGNLDTVDWKEIKAALTNIKEGLEKEEVGMRFVGELSKVIERVSHASRKPSNGDGGSARADREDALGAGNSPKTRSLGELVGGGGSGRHAPSGRTAAALPGDAHRPGTDGPSKGKE